MQSQYILAHKTVVAGSNYQFSWFRKSEELTEKYSEFSATLALSFERCYVKYRVKKQWPLKEGSNLEATLKLRSFNLHKDDDVFEYKLTYHFTENPNKEILTPKENPMEIQKLDSRLNFKLSEILDVKNGGYNINYSELISIDDSQFLYLDNRFVRDYEMFSSQFSRMSKIKRSLPLNVISKTAFFRKNYSVALTFSKLTAKDEFKIYKGFDIVSEFKTQQRCIKDFEVLAQIETH
jgi:hypothetical protein